MSTTETFSKDNIHLVASLLVFLKVFSNYSENVIAIRLNMKNVVLTYIDEFSDIDASWYNDLFEVIVFYLPSYWTFESYKEKLCNTIDSIIGKTVYMVDIDKSILYKITPTTVTTPAVRKHKNYRTFDTVLAKEMDGVVTINLSTL